MENPESPSFICEYFGNEKVSFHGSSELSDRRLRAAGIEPLYLGFGRFDPRNLFKLMAIDPTRRISLDLNLGGVDKKVEVQATGNKTGATSSRDAWLFQLPFLFAFCTHKDPRR